MGKRKPDLLFVLSDQHRKFDLGCYGNSEVLTPNLDALAETGARFEHCISNSPVCVPARGSVLTGLCAQTHGAYTNDLSIRYDIESIADALKRAGYHTGYIGKWHLCGIPRDQAIDRTRRLGFEEWKVANCNHNYLDCYYDDEENVRHFRQGYEPEIFGDLAEEFIERNADSDQPFALFLSFASPHDPHNLVGEEYKKLYENREVSLRPNAPQTIQLSRKRQISAEAEKENVRGYYGHVTAIDRQMGRLLKAMEKHRRLDTALVVYTSDHGDMLGSQGTVDKQLPYEESIGVPLIFSMPGTIPCGERQELISLVDLPTTVVGLLGVEFHEAKDGRDLHKMVEGLDEGPEECYLYDLFPCHQAADKGFFAWRGLRTRRYTYATHADGTDWLLFDHETDPYQLHNLVQEDSLQDVKAALHKKLAAYVEKYDGFMSGNEYIRFSHRVEEFDSSQLYFSRPTLAELEELEAKGLQPESLV